MLHLSPTLYSSQAYGHLFGHPALRLSLEARGFINFYTNKDQPGVAFLQQKAPFMQAELEPLAADEFLSQIEEGANRIGCNQIEFIAPPAPYANEASWLLPGPLEPIFTDFNYHLEVKELDFQEGLPGDQRRVLRKMQENIVRSEQVGVELLPVIYQILARNRAAKGYPMSISLGALVDALVAIPGAYQAYLCFTKSTKAIGGAVVVKPRSDIYYTFLLGHDTAAPGSPILSLLHAIYRDAQVNKVSYLDLGTASKDGIAIEGLQQFKKSVGGIESLKRTYKLTI